MKNYLSLVVLLLALVLVMSACDSGDSATASPEEVVAAFQGGGCIACHVIPGIPGATGNIGPDLSRMGEIAEANLQSSAYTGTADTVDEYVREAIE